MTFVSILPVDISQKINLYNCHDFIIIAYIVMMTIPYMLAVFLADRINCKVNIVFRSTLDSCALLRRLILMTFS